MKTGMSNQASIRTVIQRGGTSKGLYLLERDLPAAGVPRDRLLARLMGSPDALQIDGLGGARPITSKIAIVARSAREDADIDYTFAQVDITTGKVGYDGNCGNISSGVGPFCIDEGLVPAEEGLTKVRIFNTNTRMLLIAEVPTQDGRTIVDGDYAIPGVPGTGAEIKMNWVATIGAKTGLLLPTGNPVDTIVLEDGRHVAATICDAANPCVWVRGSEFGLTGNEAAPEINANETLLAMVREVRAKAAVLFGFAEHWHAADAKSPGLPMLGLMSAPVDYRTINGLQIGAEEMDVRVHLIFLGSLHESIAGTGSICLAAASRIPGSVVHQLTVRQDAEVLLIGHPSGVMPVNVQARTTTTAPFIAFDNLGFSRTSRRIMEGTAFVPAEFSRDRTPAAV
ncbi:2-methylaconitate cis-trans isomerase PrpF family protein [Lichenicoccus sp.]|uniref:2-methylaconitate cis-trans isomerase PrpF family protein n=1 Tax=Lichenicoccus sp. TaxID=2781899 RepID=UPI003D11235D